MRKGYFEKVETGNGVLVRVYPLPEGAPVVKDCKTHEEADAFVKVQLAKLEGSK